MGTQAQPGTALQISEQGEQRQIQQTETSSTAVAAREKASVEARFLMALHQPRNPDQARTRLMKRCESPTFAKVAEYSKPIGGKRVTGGSIRLREECARQWGNIDVQSIVVFDDRERRIVRVTVTDLESNYSQSVDVALEKTVERRSPRSGDEILSERVNSNGERVYKIVADEDAFFVKQNANVAKARREMIRAVVPGDITEDALERASQTRQDRDAKDPAGARKDIAEAFFKIGVMATQLCDFLDKPSLEAITQAELEVLRHTYTAIREGETTWKEVMEEKGGGRAAAPQGRGSAGLKEKLGGGKKKDEEQTDTTKMSLAEIVRIKGGGSPSKALEAYDKGAGFPLMEEQYENLLVLVDQENNP
jgi:hypothetical protein